MESDPASFYPVTFSISKKPTVKQRLQDMKSILLIFGAIFIVAFLVPPLTILFGSPLFLVTGNSAFYVFSMFLIGVAIGVGTVYSMRLITLAFMNGSQKRISELETRLKAGSENVVSDLDLLITENLKCGRPQVAEYYSKQLMSLCENAHHKDIVVPDLMVSTKAWVSRPEYHKSLNYFALWMFESHGLLCLSKDHLEYESSRISFRVDLKDIVDIGVDHHSRWIKPYPLRFIKIRFREREYGTESTFILTPYLVQTDTVWDINKRVAEWYNELTKALQNV